MKNVIGLIPNISKVVSFDDEMINYSDDTILYQPTGINYYTDKRVLNRLYGLVGLYNSVFFDKLKLLDKDYSENAFNTKFKEYKGDSKFILLDDHKFTVLKTSQIESLNKITEALSGHNVRVDHQFKGFLLDDYYQVATSSITGFFFHLNTIYDKIEFISYRNTNDGFYALQNEGTSSVSDNASDTIKYLLDLDGEYYKSLGYEWENTSHKMVLWDDAVSLGKKVLTDDDAVILSDYDNYDASVTDSQYTPSSFLKLCSSGINDNKLRIKDYIRIYSKIKSKYS